jgi:tight adherence protein B
VTGAAQLAAAAAAAASVLVVAAVLSRLDRWRTRPPASRRPGTPVPHWFASVAAEAGLPVAQSWRCWRAALVAMPSALVPVAPSLALLVAAALVAAPFVARPSARRRGERRFDADLPAALDAVARSLRAGASLRQALGDAAGESRGPVAADLHGVVAATVAGIPLAEALDGWGRARRRGDVLLAVAALQLAIETGGASARAVDGLAATIRRRAAVQDEARALSAQARASALVLACAPLAVCAFTVVAGGEAADFLLHTPLGLACLAGGLSLDALGGWWMARLTRAGGVSRTAAWS